MGNFTRAELNRAGKPRGLTGCRISRSEEFIRSIRIRVISALYQRVGASRCRQNLALFSRPCLGPNLRLGVEIMKSRDTVARLRRFQVDETRRRVAQIETMIAEFSRMAQELEREIAIEEQRAGISDISHFAYPTYARAVRARRDNLQRSAEELTTQLDEARLFLDEALAGTGKGRILDRGGTALLAG